MPAPILLVVYEALFPRGKILLAFKPWPEWMGTQCGRKPPLVRDSVPHLLISDVHRDFTPRTLSGYMPEEIWRKAGE